MSTIGAVTIRTGGPTTRRRMRGAASGSSSASGLLDAYGQLIGGADGLASPSGLLTADGALIGGASGVAAPSGLLTADGALIGGASGVAAPSGLLTADGALAGNTSGLSTVAGTLRYEAYDFLNWLLGVLLLECWDSRLGIGYGTGVADVQTWTGQKLGTVLSAAAVGNRPLYTAANATFRGKPSVDFAVMGTKYLRNLSYGLALTGARPYFGLVLCDRDGTGHGGVDYKHISLENSGSTFRRQFYTNGSTNFRAVTTGFASTLSRTPLDTSAHFFELWNDGATGASFSEDGSDVTNAVDTAALADDCTKFSVGAFSGGGQPGNSSAAIVFQCSAPPSPTQRAQIKAFFQTFYGTP